MVYLVGKKSNPGTGTVWIHFNGQDYPICYKSFTQTAAASVCRQLGYTNGTYEGGTSPQ